MRLVCVAGSAFALLQQGAVPEAPPNGFQVHWDRHGAFGELTGTVCHFTLVHFVSLSHREFTRAPIRLRLHKRCHHRRESAIE